MREYKILFDTGEARNLEDKINHLTKEGWSVDSISGMGFPSGIHGVYALMIRETNNDKPMKILLIEGNINHNTPSIQNKLAEKGTGRINIERAFLLSKGLEYLTKDEFGLVLLDIDLPDSKGLSAISKIYEQTKNTPIVAVTDLYNKELAVEGVKKGYVKDYLIKPVDTDKLIHVVKSFM